MKAIVHYPYASPVALRLVCSAILGAVLLAPAVVGNLGLTAWLLATGVKVRRESSTGSSSGAHHTPADAQIAGATGGTR